MIEPQLSTEPVSVAFVGGPRGGQMHTTRIALPRSIEDYRLVSVSIEALGEPPFITPVYLHLSASHDDAIAAARAQQGYPAK